MFQLICILTCSIELLTEQLCLLMINYASVLAVINIVGKLCIYLFLIMFIISWIYLCYIFYEIFGTLYHLRKKRFIKYTKPIGWFYEKFVHKSFYEQNHRERNNIAIFSLSGIDFSKIINGGTILFLYKDNFEYDSLISNFIKETVNNGETVDYITTYKSPINICKSYDDNEAAEIVKRFSIIDCFSSHYGFDDKVLKFAKKELEKKGYKFYNADSFSSIHTAANNSWYRFRKLCKKNENLYRMPHRTIYDTLSSLIRFSSEELFLVFFRHVVTSEKSYGMISLIIEPQSLKDDLKSELIRMSDIVIEHDGNSFVLIK